MYSNVPQQEGRLTRYWKIGAVLATLALAGYFGWQYWSTRVGAQAMAGIASGNGRIEAAEIDVAARTAGRLSNVLVREGDFVVMGTVVARMDIEQLSAQKREAEAQLARARVGIDTAKSVVTQRLAEKEAAAAVVAQNDIALQSAQKRLGRSEQLSRSGTVSEQALDDDRSRVETAKASLSAAKAQLAATDAAIGAARSQVIDAEASVDAAQATIERFDADLRDAELKAPRSGRIQYLVARPGEVVAGRRGPAICHPRPDLLRVRCRAVHAQDGGNRGRAPETDVPPARAGAGGTAAEICGAGEDRPARPGLRQARPGGRMAGSACQPHHAIDRERMPCSTLRSRSMPHG